MAAKVGVCLAGCGVLDGTEITEAVCTLLALDQAGAAAVCLAPAKELEEVDHLTGKPTGRKRSVLAESARIARGEVRDAGKVRGADLDALIIPGGFGAAKNLCDFATAGPQAQVDAEVARLAGEILAAGKPLGAICIAPALVAALFRGNPKPVRLTIGNDPGTAKALAAMGARHEERAVAEICIDEAHRVVTTPAYMLGRGPAEVFRGIQALVRQVLAMVR